MILSRTSTGILAFDVEGDRGMTGGERVAGVDVGGREGVVVST
jgi:hypothetical protein